MNNDKDIVQIGLPTKADDQLKELVRDTPWFGDEMTAYKVAVAVALAHEWKNPASDNELQGGRDTKFRAVLLDPDGRMRKLIEQLAPECGLSPYRYSQWLATAGVNFLHSELIGKTRSLVDVLDLDAADEGSQV